jgi:cytochrome c peroxidase
MSVAARTLTRQALRAGSRRTFTTAAAAQQPFRQWQRQSSRGYSSEAPKPEASSSSATWAYVAAAAAVGGGAFWFFSKDSAAASSVPKVFKATKEDYQKVYNTIAKRLEEKDDYDDGSYGPVLLRLAWHASGTYDKETGTGGSNGATMRFAPESDHGANAGLKAARDFLEPVKGELLF